MIFVRTTPEVLEAAGDAITFPSNGTKCNPNIRHRAGSGAFTLRSSGCACNPAKYHVAFHANLTGFTGQATLGIYQDGELLEETVVNVVSGATTYILSVDTFTEVLADISASTITVRTLTPGVTVNTAELLIERRA